MKGTNKKIMKPKSPEQIKESMKQHVTEQVHSSGCVNGGKSGKMEQYEQQEKNKQQEQHE